jgi:hypothetical protein
MQKNRLSSRDILAKIWRRTEIHSDFFLLFFCFSSLLSCAYTAFISSSDVYIKCGWLNNSCYSFNMAMNGIFYGRFWSSMRLWTFCAAILDFEIFFTRFIAL